MKESAKQDLLLRLESLRDVVGNNPSGLGVLNAIVAMVQAQEVCVEKEPEPIEVKVEAPVKSEVEVKSEVNEEPEVEALEEAEPAVDETVEPIEPAKKAKTRGRPAGRKKHRS